MKRIGKRKDNSKIVSQAHPMTFDVCERKGQPERAMIIDTSVSPSYSTTLPLSSYISLSLFLSLPSLHPSLFNLFNCIIIFLFIFF